MEALDWRDYRNSIGTTKCDSYKQEIKKLKKQLLVTKKDFHWQEEGMNPPTKPSTPNLSYLQDTQEQRWSRN